MFSIVYWGVFGCDYAYLPQSLDTYSFLGTDQQFHTAATYQVNFTKVNEYTEFTLQEESALRIYTAPHEVDISLYFYQGNDLIKVYSIIFSFLSHFNSFHLFFTLVF